MKQKYLIDTKENKLFLKEMCENLLNFGHQFPGTGRNLLLSRG